MMQNNGVNEKSIFVHKNFNKEPENKTKLALFDLDDTLIKYPVHTKLSNKSPWSLLHKDTINELKKYDEKGYLIGILSNQLNLHPYLWNFKKKLKQFLTQFGFPVVFIASLNYDFNRKPLPGMFHYVKQFVKNYEGGFFVGDAAGRESDHSCCDIKFAYNCNISFYTPESFFLKKPNIQLITYDIMSYKNLPVVDLNKKIIIVFGKGKNSGKTHFCKNFFKNHLILRNNECLQSNYIFKEKCVLLNIKKINDLKRIIENNDIKEVECYFLNYDRNVLHFLRTFSKFTGKKSLSDLKNNELNKYFTNTDCKNEIAVWFNNTFKISLRFIDFIFVGHEFNEYQKSICKYIL